MCDLHMYMPKCVIADSFYVVNILNIWVHQIDITHLIFRFHCKADEHEDQDRVEVVLKRGPVVDTESCHEGTHQHKEYGAGAQDRTAHQHHL